MTTKTWKTHPLSTVIVELLKRKGATTDNELYNMIKEIYSDLGFSAMNRELMRLEINGMIYVSALARGKRRIEYVEKGSMETKS